jgi:hypothetical protein
MSSQEFDLRLQYCSSILACLLWKTTLSPLTNAICRAGSVRQGGCSVAAPCGFDFIAGAKKMA